MPRQDRYSDELMSRERGSGDFEGRPGAFFGGRGERDWRGERDFDRGRERARERDRFREEERRFGADDFSRGIPLDETERLIASNKVEGTPVYDRHGDRLGTIHNFMVDKIRGNVVYAVLRHGGFLGLGERYYPLDWDQLTYDTRLGGYHLNLEEEDLKGLESFDSEGRRHGRSTRGRYSREPGREFGRERELREPW